MRRCSGFLKFAVRRARWFRDERGVSALEFALIMPFLLTLEYTIGYWLLSHPHTWPAKMVLKDLHLWELWNWATFINVGRPMLVGSLFISAPAALITYAVMLPLLKRREARRLKRESEAHASPPAQ